MWLLAYVKACKSVNSLIYVFLLLLDLPQRLTLFSTPLCYLDSSHAMVLLHDQALTWMESYLCNRKQSVAINFSVSSSHDLHFGVPPGSVLRPMLFSLYTSLITYIIRSHGLNYHLYSDDTSTHSCTWYSIPPIVRTSLQLRHVLKLVPLKFVFGCLVTI